jgi:hypothetical protein
MNTLLRKEAKDMWEQTHLVPKENHVLTCGATGADIVSLVMGSSISYRLFNAMPFHTSRMILWSRPGHVFIRALDYRSHSMHSALYISHVSRSSH